MNGDKPVSKDRGKRLDSWKAIAEFLGRDVRSVQRWERERGLPVRRVPGERGGGVFAYTGELNDWLRGGSRNITGSEHEHGAAEVDGASEGARESPTEAAGLPRATDVATANPKPEIASARSIPGASRRRMLLGVAFSGFLVLVGVVYLFRPWRRPAPSPPAKVLSGRSMLAVLPFLNLSGDPAQDYFADGLTEEMITDLGRMNPKALGVIARTSAIKYKGTREDVKQIGRELGVGYILEGSVCRAGNVVRISAQLIQVSDQTHIWAQNYERQVRDILSVQQDVAEAIASKIRINLSRGQRVRIVQPRPSNPEAYDDYLKGLYLWNRRGVNDLEESARFFNQATPRDPNYAPAYAGLAQCYALLALDVGHHRQEALAKAAARRAVELDNSSAQTLTALAGIRVIFDHDWQEAGADFTRAISLNPNYALAHHWYANLYLDPQGRLDEAIAEMKQAQEIDPLSLIINTDLGYAYNLAGQTTAALQQYRKVLVMDPTFVPAHYRLVGFYEHSGAYKDWLRQYVKALRQIGDPALAQVIERLYAGGGYRSVMEEEAKSMGTFGLASEGARRSFASAAQAYMMLGDKDHALAMLEQSYAHREPYSIYLKVEPSWYPLRADPRFQALERKMGLLAILPARAK